MQTPSAKVTTQFVVGLVLTIAGYLAQDQSWLDSLPGWAAIVVGQVVALAAAYQKRETNPARSEAA